MTEQEKRWFLLGYVRAQAENLAGNTGISKDEATIILLQSLEDNPKKLN